MNNLFDKFLIKNLYSHSDFAEPVFGIDICDNIVYLDSGKTHHTLSVFRPENNSEKLPVIINVHCEGFVCENNGYDRNFCAYLASKGFCVVSVNLPPAVNNDYRSLVENVTDAFIYIEKNADSISVDCSKAFLCASSVGANLCLASVCINQSPLLRQIYKFEEYSLSFRAMALSSPVTELSFIKNNPLLSDVKNALFGESPLANPIYICSSFREVIENSSSIPPLYIISSVEDKMNTESLNLASLLRKRNIEHKLRYIEKGKFYPLLHSFNVLFPEYSESMAVNNGIASYFKSKL